jgi:hypothetical protein
MGIIGRSGRITYDDGMVIDVAYLSETSLRWTGVAGEAAGQSGAETIDLIEFSSDIYIMAWIEANGVTVTNVVDVARGTIAGVATFDTPEGRQTALQRGMIEFR